MQLKTIVCDRHKGAAPKFAVATYGVSNGSGKLVAKLDLCQACTDQLLAFIAAAPVEATAPKMEQRALEFTNLVERVAEFVASHGKTTTKNIAAHFDLSMWQTRKAVDLLVKTKRIKKIGTTSGQHLVAA